MNCQLKQDKVTKYLFVFIKLKYMHRESNYTQSPIKLIPIQKNFLPSFHPYRLLTRHSLCMRFVLGFDSLDVNMVLENGNIYPLLPS